MTREIKDLPKIKQEIRFALRRYVQANLNNPDMKSDIDFIIDSFLEHESIKLHMEIIDLERWINGLVGVEEHRKAAAALREKCVGHKHAKIAWPHRELHNAADSIDRMLGDRAEAQIDFADLVGHLKSVFPNGKIPESVEYGIAKVKKSLE